MKLWAYSKMSLWSDRFLKKGQVYILPTGLGVYFLFFLLVLFGLSLSYGHSLAFSATFFVFSLTSVAAVMTNENMRHLNLESFSNEVQIYANESASALFVISNSSSSDKYFKIAITKSDGSISSELFHLKAGEVRSCSLPIFGKRRGVYQLKNVRIEGRYPFGLFKAWSSYKISTMIYVAPEVKHIDQVDMALFRRIPKRDIDKVQSFKSGRQALNTQREDFYEHRYINSEHEEAEARDIDWKVFAKKGELYQKVYSGKSNDHVVVVDYTIIPGEREQKLSIMMKASIELEQMGSDFFIKTPKSDIYPTQNDDFIRKIQRELASFSQRDYSKVMP